MEYWRNDYNRGAPIAFAKNEEAILGCRYSDVDVLRQRRTE